MPIRKPTRLQGYDYSQSGIYFITICTKSKQNLLGEIVTNTITLSPTGEIVKTAIEKISQIHSSVIVDNYVVMPNHVHMLLALTTTESAMPRYAPPPSTPTVSHVVRGFKEYVSKAVGVPIWQKSFHDHVVRDEPTYLKIWQYIEENPLRWEIDCHYIKENNLCKAT